MERTDRDHLVPWMVYLGAVLLIGLPSAIVALGVFGELLPAVGLGGVVESNWGVLLLYAISLLIGLQVAAEVAAVRLGGVEALGRGSPRVALVRHAAFSVCAFALLVAVTWLGLSVALDESWWLTAGLGLLVGLAGLVALYRGSRAFVSGVRGGTDAQ